MAESSSVTYVTAVCLSMCMFGNWEPSEATDTIRADTVVSIGTTCLSADWWLVPAGTQLSITFSVGATFSMALMNDGIPEHNDAFWCALITGSSVLNAGYRWHDSIKMADSEIAPVALAVGNTDTVWSAATNMPDTLFGLDSIGYPFGSSLGKAPGKWCFYNYCPGTNSSHPYCYSVPLENHTAIMYVRTGDSRGLKVQVSDFERDSVDPGYPALGGGTRISEFRVRWAVDSAGNGLFKHEGAAVRPALSNPGAGGSAVRGSPMAPFVSRPYFDLRGRPMALPSSGVYITSEGRAVMMRRHDALWQ